MPYLEREGFKLHYEFDPDSLVAGKSRPVVMLSNSLGTSMALWDAQLAALRTSFRVLRYDTRGHGRSGVPEGEYAMAQLGHDAVVLLDALDIEVAHFCGISIGGMTGMWLALNHPGRVDRLALCTTAAYIGPPDSWAARIGALRDGSMAALADGILSRWFTPEFMTSAPEQIAPVRAQLIATDKNGYARCCAAIRDADLRSSIGSIRSPTLVISGTRDPATPPSDGRLIASSISGAQFREVDAAHLSNIEAAETFTSYLMQFLRDEVVHG